LPSSPTKKAERYARPGEGQTSVGTKSCVEYIRQNDCFIKERGYLCRIIRKPYRDSPFIIRKTYETGNRASNIDKTPSIQYTVLVEDSESGAVCHSPIKGVMLMWKNIIRTIVCVLLAIVVMLAMSIKAY
jgi:hypothetical protein